MLAHVVERARAGDRLDAAHALGDAGLLGDLEEARCRRCARRGCRRRTPSTRPCVTHAHGVAVLLAEEGDGAAPAWPRRWAAPRSRWRRCLRTRALTRSSTVCFSSSRQRARSARSRSAGDRAPPASPSASTCVAEHVAQRPVQEVRRRVVAADGVAALDVDGRARPCRRRAARPLSTSREVDPERRDRPLACRAPRAAPSARRCVPASPIWPPCSP